MKNNNIYFIVHSLGNGGAERVISILSNYLVEHGYNVTLLITHSNKCTYKLNDKINIVMRENIREKDGLQQIKFMRKWYKKDKDGIFISFSRRHNVYALIAGIGTRVKLILSERSNADEKFKLGDKDTYELKIIKELSKLHFLRAFVFQTDGAKQCYPMKVQKKGYVIANPLNDDLPDPHTGERTKRVVAVGRLSNEKNYGMLIRAFSKFHKTHSDYTLEIYGDGYLREPIEEYINKNGMSEYVKLCGFSENIHEKILDAQMYVLSSKFEGLSNALLEAMAIGIPVISTDHPSGGARAFIKSYENGILTTVGKAGEMYSAMTYIADNTDKAQEMANNAITIRKDLQTEVICEKWVKLFNKI